MPWVRFIADHDEREGPLRTVGYRRGDVGEFDQAAAEALQAARKARILKHPPKDARRQLKVTDGLDAAKRG